MTASASQKAYVVAHGRRGPYLQISPGQHDKNCEWHCDQYNFECTCGAAIPEVAYPEFCSHPLKCHGQGRCMREMVCND